MYQSKRNLLRLWIFVVMAKASRVQLKQADGEPTAGQGAAGVKLRYTLPKDNTWFDWAYNKARNGYHRSFIPAVAASTLGDTDNKTDSGNKIHAYTGVGIRDAHPFPIPGGAGGTVNTTTTGTAPRVQQFPNTLLGRVGKYLAHDSRLDDFAAGRQQLTNEEGEKHLGMLAYADHVTQNAAKQLPTTRLGGPGSGFQPTYLNFVQGVDQARNSGQSPTIANKPHLLRTVPVITMNSDSTSYSGSLGTITHELGHSWYRRHRPTAVKAYHRPFPAAATADQILAANENENLYNYDLVKLMPSNRSLYNNVTGQTKGFTWTNGIQDALDRLSFGTLADLGQIAPNDPGVAAIDEHLPSLPKSTVDAVISDPQTQEILRRGNQIINNPNGINPNLRLKKTDNVNKYNSPVFE